MNTRLIRFNEMQRMSGFPENRCANFITEYDVEVACDF